MFANCAWLQRLGFLPADKERKLWLIGGSRDAFSGIAPMLEELADAQPRLRVILSAAEIELRIWLKDRFPDCMVTNLPLNNFLSIKIYLGRGNVRVAVALEDVSAVKRPLIVGLRRAAVGLVALSTRHEAPAPAAIIAQSCEVMVETFRGGPETDRSCESSQRKRGLSNREVTELLSEMLGRDLKARRDRVERMGRFWQFVLDHCDHRMIKWRLRRYDDVADVSVALGRHDTILCLGNGPSSEDDGLKGMAHDVLFRVNHVWLERGFLTRPDVVFTGGRPSMRTVSGAIFGLQHSMSERRLAALRLFNPLLATTRFFNVAKVNPILDSFAWGAVRPTNGATMIAAAVALNPSRLIIAGIDLFQHLDGSYPGDTTTPNAYPPAHAREAELAFLLTLFERYRGELVIIGDVLQAAWRHREVTRSVHD